MPIFDEWKLGRRILRSGPVVAEERQDSEGNDVTHYYGLAYRYDQATDINIENREYLGKTRTIGRFFGTAYFYAPGDPKTRTELRKRAANAAQHYRRDCLINES
ncbi:MAG: hypothetical protein QMD85_05020 [Candidatus Aenigmarchaeota archaeon]|nr:hypothetical protein [Candidatus Aenigmarchaeota archaeon]